MREQKCSITLFVRGAKNKKPQANKKDEKAGFSLVENRKHIFLERQRKKNLFFKCSGLVCLQVRLTCMWHTATTTRSKETRLI